jgi:hypothetical protein
VELKLTPTSAGGRVPESFRSRSEGFDCGTVALDVEAALFNDQALSKVKHSSEMVKANT